MRVAEEESGPVSREIEMGEMEEGLEEVGREDAGGAENGGAGGQEDGNPELAYRPRIG